jgi:membrane protease YdiL (CAAX protease family)
MRIVRFLQTYDTSVVIAILFAIGGVLAWICIGPGAALRGFAAEAAILGVTFYVARQYLPWKDAPKDRIKRARTELIIGLISYVFWLVGAAELFSGGNALPWLLAGTLLPVVILIYGRYSSRAWGLRLPKGRDLLVLAAVVVITFALSKLFGAILPLSEIASPDATLRQHLIGGSLIVSLVLAAVLEELFFRVYLQPRLAAYLSGRWALFAQAVLYSAAFLPLYLIGAHYPLQYAIALTLVLSNGIMAGYFWRKTGNLPLLILLHLLAFSRFGLM